MNLFEAKATINLSESAKQLLIVKQLVKQLNEEFQKLEIQVEWEKNGFKLNNERDIENLSDTLTQRLREQLSL